MAYQAPSLWAPALVVGGAILASGFAVKSAVDGNSSRLDKIHTSIVETRQALNAAVRLGGGGSAAAAPARKKRGPDPNKKYEVKTAGRPTKGALQAKVEIIEFSDFE